MKRVSLLGCAILVAALFLEPGGLLGFALAPILLFLAAAPILKRAAADEPAPLKLFLFSALFSPLLVGGLWMLGSALVGDMRVGFTLVALLVCFAWDGLYGERGCEREKLGPGQVAACLLALGFSGLVALALFNGEAARASFHGLLHASISQSAGAGMPPENPWLAGSTLGYYWVWHALGAAYGELLGLASTKALALLNVWAAVCLPLGLYFLGAPLWRRARIELAGVVLGLAGLNLLGGFVWLGRGAPFVEPTWWTVLLGNMRGLVFAGMDPRVAWGPSKFGNLSSYPAALVLLLGGLVATGHALREVDGEELRARKTWCGLAGVALGFSTLINPLVGAAGLLAGGCVCLLRHRFGFLSLLVLGSLPGVWLALVASGARAETGIEIVFSMARVNGVLAALGPLLVCACACALWARPKVGERSARDFFDLVWAGALTSMLIAMVVVLPEGNEYKFVRTAALCLAPLAAGAPFVLARRGGASKLVGMGLGIGLVIGLGCNCFLGLRNYAAWSSQAAGIAESAGVLLPKGDTDLARAMVFLRDYAKQSERRPVLILNPPEPGSAGWDFGGGALVDQNNLQGHAAAAFSGAALFCDRRSYLVDSDPDWIPRLNIVRSLFSGVRGSASALVAELSQPRLANRPHVLIATKESGMPTANALSVLNWPEVWTSGDVHVWIEYVPSP